MPHRYAKFLRWLLVANIASVWLFVLCAPAWSQSESPTAKKQGENLTATEAPKSPSASLGVYVYPKNNQPLAQQQKDENECFGWAKEQTGIDPAAPPESASKQQANAPKGGAVKGATGGAAGGAAVGAIAGDAGRGAAAGATVGAIRGRRAQKKAEKQAEQQAKANAQTAQQQKSEKFRKAFSACMEARNYSVK